MPEEKKQSKSDVLFGDAYSSGYMSEDGAENRQFYLERVNKRVPRGHGSTSSVSYHLEQGGLPGADIKGYETSTLDEIGDSKNHGTSPDGNKGGEIYSERYYDGLEEKKEQNNESNETSQSRSRSIKGKDAIRDNGKNGQIVCLSPDVCLTKIGKHIVPIPYMIVSKLSWSEMTVTNTTFGGLEAFTMASRTNMVKGDERGKYGGVKSGVNKGWCRPQTNKSSFYVKGHQVIHHDHIYEMNCAGPNGPSNTVGKIRFVEAWKADDKPLEG